MTTRTPAVKRFALLWVTVFTLAYSASAQDPNLEKAQKLYTQTQYQAAVQLLVPIPNKSAEQTALLGRSYYMLGSYRDATEWLHRAIDMQPANGSYYHWLGRAYGRRAETAFPAAAPAYASKARVNLEKAVALDPTDGESLDDLFEYYLEAPAILGGGWEKAAKIAERIAKRDPAEGAFANARLAEQRKDWSKAETCLRRAAELAPSQPGRLIDLAKLLSKQGRYEESDAIFQKAHQVAPDAAKVYFAEAAAYIRANRKSDQARELLKKYLAMSVSPDDPSKTEARKLLNRVS